MNKHTTPRTLILVATAAALCALPVHAQTPNRTHPGIRRWSVTFPAHAMYAPNGSSMAGIGARGSYQVHAYFDVDASVSYVRLLGDTNQSRNGILLEGGGTLSAHLGTPRARLGAFVSAGGMTNADTWMLAFGGGVELRFGTACSLTSNWGFDGRLRVGTRVLPGLNGESPVGVAHGVELALGFGDGGARVIRSNSREQSAMEHMVELVRRDFRDMVSEDERRNFPVCRTTLYRTDTPAELLVDMRDQEDDAHACTVISGSRLDGVPANGCALYLASHPEDDGAEVSAETVLASHVVVSGTDTTGQPSPQTSAIGSYRSDHGMSVLLACSMANALVRGRLVNGDRDLTSVIGRVSLALPPNSSGTFTALPASREEPLLRQRLDYFGMISAASTWHMPLDASGRVCVYAPRAAALRVTFEPKPRSVTPPAIAQGQGGSAPAQGAQGTTTAPAADAASSSPAPLELTWNGLQADLRTPNPQCFEYSPRDNHNLEIRVQSANAGFAHAWPVVISVQPSRQ